jgi:CRISPR-associated protein Cmr6
MTPPVKETTQVLRTPGPLRDVVTLSVVKRQGDDVDPQDRVTVTPMGMERTSNARILLHRTAFPDHEDPHQRHLDARPVLGWAERNDLGQPKKLVAAVAARRTAALKDLSHQGYTVQRLTLEPVTRLAVGHGDHANPYEAGLALHGTYGWPCLPGSSLKGMADAYARSQAGDGDRPVSVEDRSAVLGAPRPTQEVPGAPRQTDTGQPARQGQVQFLDALPARSPVTVTRDVLTPHVQPYYTWIAERGDPVVPPAEHYHPVPVEFLTVSKGEFAVDLVGDELAVMLAAEWVQAAVDELGLGAKTAAGYGYAKATDRPLPLPPSSSAESETRGGSR